MFLIRDSPFIPPEWIAAHGLRPLRLLPWGDGAAPGQGRAGSIPIHGICPYARAFAAAATAMEGVAGIVLTTDCDPMRRIADLIDGLPGTPPVHLFHLPATWETPAARGYYRAELERLGRFLVRVGGTAPSDETARAAYVEFESRRTRLRGALPRLRSRAAAEALVRFHETGDVGEAIGMEGAREMEGTTDGDASIPLAVVGAPLFRRHLEVHDWIESHGGRVVLDATGFGERTLPAPIAPPSSASDVRASDPLDVLVAAYFDSIPDAFRRPDSALHEWLRRESRRRGVRGVLFHRHTWCDTWAAEREVLRESVGLPLLPLDLTEEDSVAGRVKTKLEAFLEALR